MGGQLEAPREFSPHSTLPEGIFLKLHAHIGSYTLQNKTNSRALIFSISETNRENGDDDITIDILYSGICHSDLHMVKNELGISIYPMVPGYNFISSTYFCKNINTF